MSTDPRVERALVLYNEVFLSLDEMSCATPKSFAAEAAFKAHLESMAAEIARLTAELEETRKDAGRWQQTLWFVAGVPDCRHGAHFGMPRLAPVNAANIMRGSVAEHFTKAIDAAMTKEATHGRPE